VELLTEIAHRRLGDTPVNWRKLQDTHYIRELIAKTIPGYEKIAELDQNKQEFTISGRILTEPKFPTPSDKAKMWLTPLPQLSLPTKTELGLSETTPGIVVILGTGRSYGQHNTVVYREYDKYRGIPHRHCILMNRHDVKNTDFVEHQKVKIKGNAGQLEDIEIICGEVRENTAFMFYPEANVLFHAEIDELSGTPNFKRIPVCIFT
jgi:anaerobic selenocysteine-containing dehydrogenase